MLYGSLEVLEEPIDIKGNPIHCGVKGIDKYSCCRNWIGLGMLCSTQTYCDVSLNNRIARCVPGFFSKSLHLELKIFEIFNIS